MVALDGAQSANGDLFWDDGDTIGMILIALTPTVGSQSSV